MTRRECCPHWVDMYPRNWDDFVIYLQKAEPGRIWSPQRYSQKDCTSVANGEANVWNRDTHVYLSLMSPRDGELRSSRTSSYHVMFALKPGRPRGFNFPVFD